MRPDSLLLAVFLATLCASTVSAQPLSAEEAPDDPDAGLLDARPVTRCVVGDRVGAFHQTSQLLAANCYRDCETEHRAWLTLPGFAKPVLELSQTVDGDADTSPFVVTCRRGRVSVGVPGLDAVPLELDRARGRLVVARTLRRQVERAFAGERNVDRRRWPSSLHSVLHHLDEPLLVQLDLANAREALRAGNWSRAASGSYWMHTVDVPGAVALAKELADQVRALRSTPPVRVVDVRVVASVRDHVFEPLWSAGRLCFRDLGSPTHVRCGAPPSFEVGPPESRPAPIAPDARWDHDRSSDLAYLSAPGVGAFAFPGHEATGIPQGLRLVFGPGPRALVLLGTRFALVGADRLVDATSADVTAFLAQTQGSEFIGDRWIVHDDETGKVLREPPGLSVSSVARPGHEWRLFDGAQEGVVSPDGRWVALGTSDGGWRTLRVGRLVEGGP